MDEIFGRLNSDGESKSLTLKAHKLKQQADCNQYVKLPVQIEIREALLIALRSFLRVSLGQTDGQLLIGLTL